MVLWGKCGTPQWHKAIYLPAEIVGDCELVHKLCLVIGCLGSVAAHESLKVMGSFWIISNRAARCMQIGSHTLYVESIYAYSVWCIRSLVPRLRPVFHGLQYEKVGEGFIRECWGGPGNEACVSITSCPELAWLTLPSRRMHWVKNSAERVFDRLDLVHSVLLSHVRLVSCCRCLSSCNQRVRNNSWQLFCIVLWLISKDVAHLFG